ncbi:MAG: S41 family peptidase [Planctomycetes bacterium]|nr:S41 family peptidase [Planctomycetota bacterium]
MFRRTLLGLLLIGATSGLLFWAFDAVGEQKTKDAELFKECDRFIEILRLVQKQYVRDVETKKMFEHAINGMLTGLDPFSNYIPEEDLAEFNKSTRGKFGGIGIQIGMRRGLLTVISPLEGTPAYQAGVLSGDIIFEIDGKSTEGVRLDEAVKILTGDPNTKVTLKVRHITGETAEISITRAIIEVHTVKGVRRDDKNEWVYIIDETHKIGYVRLASFVENSAPDMKAAMDALQKEGMKALVLDLRFDPGGILKTAIEISDMFIEDGVIVKTKGRTTPYWEATATKDGTLPYFPMVVLVNQYSASASEILAGALQDHHRAIIVGERSFGKGSVQNVIPLQGEQAALKLTTSKYYLPSGRNIHREEDMTDKDEWGVMPDIVVPMKPEEYVALLRGRLAADVIRNHTNGDKPDATTPNKDDSKKDEPKKDEPKKDEPKKDDSKAPEPGAAKPETDPSMMDLDEDAIDAASAGAAGAAGTDAKKAAPFVDRQLERGLDVLRSIEVIEKYVKKAA